MGDWVIGDSQFVICDLLSAIGYLRGVMNDDAVEFIVKLFIIAILVSIVITAAIFLGGPLLAFYTLVKGWLNVTTRVKVGAIVLPFIGAGLATWYVAQGQLASSDATALFFWGALGVSVSMVGIA